MSVKTPKLIFVFSAVACVALRVYLKLTAVDPATGFYEGGGIAVTALNLLLLVSVAALVVTGLLTGRKAAARGLRLGVAGRALALLTGLSAAVYGATFAADRFSRIDLSGGSNLKLLLLGLALQFIAFVLAPLGSAAFFLLVGLRGGREGFSTCGWLALCPLVWQIGLLLVTFMSYTAVRSVSDQMLAVLAMVFAAPFLLNHARWAGEVVRERGLAQLPAYGLPFALLALTVSAGALAALPAGRAVEVALGLPALCFYLCAGAYAAVLCFSIEAD